MSETKRQYGTGSICKLPGSRYWYILYRVDGRQIRESTKSESKMEAEKMLQRRQGELGMGLPPAQEAKRLKYEEVRNAWLQDAKNRQRGTLYTRKKDGETVVSGLPRLDKYFKAMSVVKIDTACLRRFIAHRKVEGASDPTIRRNLVILRSMMNMARKDGKLHRLPHFPMPEDSEAAGQYVAPDQFEKLLAKLPDNLHPFFKFLYATSCRIGAAKKITWSMLNDKRDVVSLPGPIVKNRKPLTIVLDGAQLAPVSAMLRKMFSKADAPVFDYTNYRVEWQKACDAVGLGVRDKKLRTFTGLRIHDLRVSGAVNMVEAGIPEDIVMKIGGWKTRAMFSRYNVVDVKRIREAMVKAGAHVARQARA